MSSDVVLTAALRNNLLSLQSTQSLIDRTQLRLATGREVNSALDNAQSFFAAQSLTNRANDLGRLLDGLGQSIQTIQAADDGIEALTNLIEQADSLATTALEASSASATGVSIVGDVDVSNFTAAAADAGTLTFTLTNESGADVALNAGGAVTIANGNDINTIINNINALRTTTGNEQLITASLTETGRLQISTSAGTSVRIELLSNDGSPTLVESEVLAGKLGLASVLRREDATGVEGGNSTSVAVNLDAAASIQSQALYRDGANSLLAQRTTLLDTLVRDANGDGTIDDQVVDFGGDAGNDTYDILIGINGGPLSTISLVAATSTVQDVIDAINNDVTLNSRITASFDESTGQITVAADDGSVTSVEFGGQATENAANTNAQLELNFGFGSAGNLDTTAGGAANSTESTVIESIRFGEGGGQIAQAQNDFNNVRTQIDALVRDSGYRGVNLLNGDNLVTTFNEDRTNQLTTTGGTFTATGLGIDEAAFATRSNIETALTQVRSALTSVRDFGSSIANDLAIIQTREDFTTNLINTLQEGSDKLTVADQNEEGANLLALQTRQQLGVTSLSLASQSQQSVLRLF